MQPQTQDSSNAPPLAGLRVVELARILAGPWIGQTLADLGATVVKVESPQGDDTRRWGPPFVENADGTRGDAAYFHCCNRGKSSITLDFTVPEGQANVRALAREADVLIENFKVGGLAKYGLDYASLRAINPRLIYCSVTGFGQTGPYAARAGYDAMIQAMSGIMDLTGEPEGQPQKIGVALADIITGLYGVIAIQAALVERARSGEGQHVDLALYDCMVGVLANQNLNYLVSGNAPRRLGNAHPNIVPYQVFAVSDGYVMLAVGNDTQYARLCDIVGTPELAREERFATNAGRVAHRGELVPILADKLSTQHRDVLLARLEAAGVPAGPINTLADVFADAQTVHRGLQLEMDAPWTAAGKVPGVRLPIGFSRSTLRAGQPSPPHGQVDAQALVRERNPWDYFETRVTPQE
jgi:crotonobetainyl-CoA:carnitine CoA-transferase CaiB-like acyl-CoA transferase